LTILLASCGPDLPSQQRIAPYLLDVPQGYQGPTPQTQGQYTDAILADRAALLQCQGQLISISELPLAGVIAPRE
jgi:hypothetical protein